MNDETAGSKIKKNDFSWCQKCFVSGRNYSHFPWNIPRPVIVHLYHLNGARKHFSPLQGLCVERHCWIHQPLEGPLLSTVALPLAAPTIFRHVSTAEKSTLEGFKRKWTWMNLVSIDEGDFNWFHGLMVWHGVNTTTGAWENKAWAPHAFSHISHLTWTWD